MTGRDPSPRQSASDDAVLCPRARATQDAAGSEDLDVSLSLGLRESVQEEQRQPGETGVRSCKRRALLRTAWCL